MFKSWKILKTILALNSNSEKRQLCLTINNVAVTNSIDIANDFNDFFCFNWSRARQGHSL